MKIPALSTLSVLVLCVMSGSSQNINAARAQTATSKIVRAANTLLSTLNLQQRKSVLFAFDDEQQRARWSNFPTGFVPRACSHCFRPP